MPEPKVDIEASLKLCEALKQGVRVNVNDLFDFIVAARDPLTGWEAALKELRELREAIGHDKLHLFYALKNAEAKQINAETEAIAHIRKGVKP